MADKTTTSQTAPSISMALVRMYANLVKAGRRTVANLPEAYRESVQAYIDNQN